MNLTHNRKPRGLALAMFGAILLTPDTLFMRLSELDGFSMLIWRGGLSGIAYFFIWTLFIWRVERQVPNVLTANFLTIVLCQMFNATLFSLAIAIAPVAIVLIAVASLLNYQSIALATLYYQ